MKVLLTANSAWNLAHFRGGLIDALRQDGHDLAALAPTDHGADGLEELGVRHIPIAIDPKGTAPAHDAMLTYRFFQVFRREQPDVILSYTIKNNIYGGLAAGRLRISFIPNVSGLGTAFLNEGWLERLVTQLYQASFRPLKHVIFQNADDRALFIERDIVRADQAVLVPGSGIDLEYFKPTTSDRKAKAPVTFLLIARLLKDKGVREFVEAARHIRTTHPNARFQLLGEVGVANRTAINKPTVDEWVSEGIIDYLKTTDDVRPYIAAADCVVLPSYREGTPRTLLEAAAMARPIVTTDVPGCRNVVDDGRTGLLCRARDAEDLARAMTRMLEMEPKARASLGQAGRRKIEREYCQSIVFDTYRNVIAEAVPAD